MTMPRILVFAIISLLTSACGAADPEGLQPAEALEQYRALSEQLSRRDHQHMEVELKKMGREKPLPAPHAKRFGFDSNNGLDFYKTESGRRIAEVVLSYQTPSGGWSKRTDMGTAPRRPGQAFGTEKGYIPTFDNGATSTQFWVMVNAFHGTGDRRYAESAQRALRLILLAQYPSGGWPQSFPLRGKYHDLITFNDGAMNDLMNIVAAVARGDERLQFVADPLRRLAADSLARGLRLLLDSQVKSDGVATIWGAQHDPETLAPADARAFEPASLATKESADLVLFLMSLENPSDEIKRAIVSAHDWFVRHRIDGYKWAKVDGRRKLVEEEGADPLWARFYELGGDRSVFGDRDGEIYYDVDEISAERNLGYGWYTEHPYKVQKQFRKWRKKHGL